VLSSFRSGTGAGLALLLITLVMLGGCSRVQGPRSWITTGELVTGGTVTFAVRDESGRIDDAEIDPAGVTNQDSVSNPAGEPGVLLVSWVGGACDERTDIGVTDSDQGLIVTIRPTVAAGACDAIGVGHTLRLTSGKPLPASTVTVHVDRVAAA
jgi:hypothetical protein